MKSVEAIPSSQINLPDIYQSYKTEGFNLVIIILLISLLFKSFKVKHPTFVTTKEIAIHNEIEEVLKNIATTIDCDRAVIGVFHTTDPIKDLLAFKVMSVLYEYKKESAPSKKDIVVNLPAIDIPSEIKNLNPFHFLKFSISQSNLSLGCKGYLERMGIHTKYCRLLSNKKNIYGIIELHHLTDPTIDLLSNSTKLKIVEDYFTQLKVLLKEANAFS